VTRLHHGNTVGPRFQHVQPFGLVVGCGRRKDIEAFQEFHLAAVIRAVDMVDFFTQAGIGELLEDVVEVELVVFPQPARDPQSALRQIGLLPQNAISFGQVVQPFFGTDAGEIADGERRIAPCPGKAIVAMQIKPRVNHMHAFARNGEVSGHKVGVEAAGRDVALDIAAVGPDQVQSLVPISLGERFEKNIVPLQGAHHRHIDALADFMQHARNQHVRQHDDVRMNLVGQPVGDLQNLFALVATLSLEHGNSQIAEIFRTGFAREAACPAQQARRIEPAIEEARRVAKESELLL
jgi:hypothetical protein